MKLDVYLNYAGTCEEAFRFYEQHVGGRISMMMKHGDRPDSKVPADWSAKVLHAEIEIGGTMLMGADIPTAEAIRSAYLSLSVDSSAEAERLYELLSSGGAVFMKMEETFYAHR